MDTLFCLFLFFHKTGGGSGSSSGSSGRRNPMPASGKTKLWRRTLWSRFDELMEGKE